MAGPDHGAATRKLFFIIDKTYVTPIRLIQFLALVAVFSLAFRYIRWLGDGALYAHWSSRR